MPWKYICPKEEKRPLVLFNIIGGKIKQVKIRWGRDARDKVTRGDKTTGGPYLPDAHHVTAYQSKLHLQAAPDLTLCYVLHKLL